MSSAEEKTNPWDAVSLLLLCFSPAAAPGQSSAAPRLSPAELRGVPEQSQESPGLLQLPCPILPDPTASLEKRKQETPPGSFLPVTGFKLQSPMAVSSLQRCWLEMIFLDQPKKNQTLMQPQLFQHPNEPALTIYFLG